METIDQFVDRQIRLGRYKDREAVVQRALEEMQERESEFEFLVEKLRPSAEAFKRGEKGQIACLKTIRKRVAQKRKSSL